MIGKLGNIRFDALRERFLGMALVATVAAFASALPAEAQDNFPEQPIRLIVPYGAGTGADIMARQIVPGMQEELGQPVIVENRPGAGAVVGTETVVTAPPDGYTLLFGATQTSINPHVYDLPFDTVSDLVPVVRVSNAPLVLAVNKHLDIESVEDLVAYAKANPGVLNYTSAGEASSPHLAGAFFGALADIDVVHVPYNNIPQAITDLVRGDLGFIFYPYVGIRGQIEAGELRVLASTNATRTSFLGDTPTLVELGYEEFVLPAWQGIFAPAGTPEIIVDKIYRSVADSLGADVSLAATLEESGTEVKIEDPAEFSEFVQRQIEVYREIVEIANVGR